MRACLIVSGMRESHLLVLLFFHFRSIAFFNQSIQGLMLVPSSGCVNLPCEFVYFNNARVQIKFMQFYIVLTSISRPTLLKFLYSQRHLARLRYESLLIRDALLVYS